MAPRDPALIVALDLPSLDSALRIVESIRPVTCWFKVGSTLFTAAGPEAVRAVLRTGGRVFLDLKFHDIPESVAGGVVAAADLGASLVTVHCAGGPAVLEAAAQAARRTGTPMRVLGVTRLTSDAGRVGAGVMRAAAAAYAAGLGGVTASAQECARIKARFGPEFHVLTPGIRPIGTAANDQARIATPRKAVEAGSDYLVVGRPIIAAADPRSAAEAIAREIATIAEVSA